MSVKSLALKLLILIFVVFTSINVVYATVCPDGMAGSGLSSSPCQISTCENLQNMSINVSANYQLINNVDCSSSGSWNAGFGFTPVGNNTNLFVGLLDGQGYNITELYINQTSSYIGLFGYLNGGVYNLGLVNINVTEDDTTSDGIGGIAGTIIGGTINHSFVTGNVSGGDNMIGGIVGLMQGGLINNSYTNVTIRGDDMIGGIVGRMNDGTIENSFSLGHTRGRINVGGFVGETSGSILNSYSTGTIIGNFRLGGFVGSSIGGTLTNSYSTGTVTDQGGEAGGAWMGGFCGTCGTTSGSFSTGVVTLVGTGPYQGGYGGTCGTVTNAYYFSGAYASACGSGSGPIGKVLAYFQGDVHPDNFPMINWSFYDIWEEIAGSFPTLVWQGMGGSLGHSTPYFSNATNDTSSFKNEYSTFNITLKDETGIDGYWFSWNISGSWVNDTWVNIPNNIYYPISTSKNITSQSGPSISWRYHANDTSGNVNVSDTYNITVINTPPTVTLNYPENDSVRIFSDTIKFNFTASDPDDYGFMNCSLYGDFTGTWKLNQTNTTKIISGTRYTFATALTLLPGTYTWNVLCYDNASTPISAWGNGSIERNYTLFISNVVCPGGMEGVGTSANPCLILNCSQLQNMTLNVSADYKLSNNINCSNSSLWTNGFEPVGNSTNSFSGTFYGNNYNITELFIDRPLLNMIGLFGKATGAIIRDVGLLDVNISGDGWVGALVGSSTTIINNSFSTGEVNGSFRWIGGLVGYTSGIINNSYSSVNVNGNRDVGGLVGELLIGTIINSYATGNVTGSGLSVGGLVGDLSTVGTIQKSYSTGNVYGYAYVGGLLGRGESGTILKSYSSSVVNGTASNIGGLVGLLEGSTDINNSYATGNVTGLSAVGGLVGYSDEGSVNNSYATGNATATNIDVGGLIGLNTGKIRDSFATGNVTGSTSIGGLVGTHTGSINNSYWNNHDGNPNDCYYGGNTGCTAIINFERYFKTDVHPNSPPMANWSFHAIWDEFLNGFPVLVWQAIGKKYTALEKTTIISINVSKENYWPLQYWTNKSIFLNLSNTEQNISWSNLTITRPGGATIQVDGDHRLDLNYSPDNFVFEFNRTGFYTNGSYTLIFSWKTAGGNMTNVTYWGITQDIQNTFSYLPVDNMFLTPSTSKNQTMHKSLLMWTNTNESFEYNFTIDLVNTSWFNVTVFNKTTSYNATNISERINSSSALILTFSIQAYNDSIPNGEYYGNITINRTFDNDSWIIPLTIGIDISSGIIEVYDATAVTYCNSSTNSPCYVNFNIETFGSPVSKTWVINNTGNYKLRQCTPSLTGSYNGQYNWKSRGDIVSVFDILPGGYYLLTFEIPKTTFSGSWKDNYFNITCIATPDGYKTDNTGNMPKVDISINARERPERGGLIGQPAPPPITPAIPERPLGVFGDGICDTGESMNSPDCKVIFNFDTIITCLWEEDIPCIYGESWFINILAYFLIGITLFTLKGGKGEEV